ncbi:unnamed protein product [Ilex paraguariensis]|uniref:Methyltransferase-like protein 13 n=1 Tax=Ilex paraguariensis TaxID=185542 RepID=A0ABC8SHI5_9AQUA
MSLDPSTFGTIVSSRFITFTFPNPTLPNPHLHNALLRIAVHDSPTTSNPSQIAAMLVPPHRESDWTFSTQPGHLQLLLSSSTQLSRLILIGNLPNSPHPTIYNPDPPILIDPVSRAKLEENLTPLVFAVLPKSAFPEKGLPEVPFLIYEDDVIRSVVVERCCGPCVGELLVEDVELESNGTGESKCSREFRRRLRFKRTPNLIQTQVRIYPYSIENGNVGFGFVDLVGAGFMIDKGILVHPYFIPMVAGLSVISSYIDEKIRYRIKPKALCLGVGGGALPSFLNSQLGFEVLAVEADDVVLRLARQYFGLQDGECLSVCVGDAIELIEKLACQVKNQNADAFSTCKVENVGCLDTVDVFDAKFDVIMVDLDSCDATMGISAPPLEFVRKSTLMEARLVLHELGILVINVIPPSKSFHETLIHEFQEVFHELYEIDVGNGENIVLIAAASPIASESSVCETSFFAKLKLVISGAYVDSIRKI